MFLSLFSSYTYISSSSLLLLLISRLLSYVFWSDNRNVALICRIAEWKKTTKIEEETHLFLNILRNLYAASKKINVRKEVILTKWRKFNSPSTRVKIRRRRKFFFCEFWFATLHFKLVSIIYKFIELFFDEYPLFERRSKKKVWHFF